METGVGCNNTVTIPFIATKMWIVLFLEALEDLMAVLAKAYSAPPPPPPPPDPTLHCAIPEKKRKGLRIRNSRGIEEISSAFSKG